MTHQVHAFEPPERFVAGTVGPPGERTFFLQARGGGRLVSVALEKVQVSLLAEKLEELLVEAQRRFGVDLPEAPVAPVVGDNEPLDTPVDEEFRVGTLGLAFDVDTATVVIEAIAAGEAETEVELGGDDEDDDDDDEVEELDEDLDRLRVRLTPEATREFIARARRVVNAGRPPCPLCGQPLDPAGHLCPRHNGYHR
ncbi:DUF3090 domain-containing protein [Micromonospora mirobrigensis]|uniref:Repeat protein (TIGR03847 family) n=1 Tax=Micromonospora mirobrigensis TaxID=262898 RepID=A0A1C4YQ21_9ACTN|nr:DUF3090 domain-containing protein [Micromonospora mirobrigensis]SCF22853.1 conserved hypothetical protein [Micromonospora mirobrigensis]